MFQSMRIASIKVERQKEVQRFLKIPESSVTGIQISEVKKTSGKSKFSHYLLPGKKKSRRRWNTY